MASLLLAVLIFSGPATLLAQEDGVDSVLTQADELIYNAQNNTVTLSGNARVAYQNNILRADKIVYDQKAGILQAHGNVRLHEKSGALLQAHSITINQTFEDGIIIAPALLFPGEARLVASKGYRLAGKTIFLDATYTPCMVCPDKGIHTPKWKITAQNLIHDQNTKTLSSTNTMLHILEMPVFYMPYLRQPDPSVKRRSGLLIPSAKTTSNLGLVVEIPYFLSLSERADFTFAPQFMTTKGALLRGKWRHAPSYGKLRGAYWLQGSGIWSAQRYAGEDSFEGSFFGKGRFEVGDHWRFGFDLQLTSNNSFLVYYDLSNRTELENHAFLEFNSPEHSLIAEAYLFRNLLEEVQTSPVVAPSITYNYRPQHPIFGGKLTTNSSFTSFNRSDGISTHRFAAGLSWDYLTQDFLGGLYVLFLDARGKVYRIVNNGQSPQKDSWEALFLPTVGLDWRMPLVHFFGKNNHVILEPRAQVIYAPGGGNPSSVPNEDSRNLDFNAANLFSRNRFSGLDRWENGFRANAGVKISYFDGSGWSGSVEVGQVLRLKENPLFDQESGLRDRTSDYVGTLELFFPGVIELTGSLRLDRSKLTLHQVDLTSTLDLGDLHIGITYVKTQRDPIDRQDAQEAIYIKQSIVIQGKWELGADWRYDIEHSQHLLYGGSLSYTDDCFSVSFSARQSRVRFRETREGWRFALRLVLKQPDRPKHMGSNS